MRSTLRKLAIWLARKLDPKPTRYLVRRYIMVDTSYRLVDEIVVGPEGQASTVTSLYKFEQL